MIYHYITNSYLIKYSDNIMINYAYMIKTLCGISKNKSLIKPVINHHIINIAHKKLKIFLDISQVIISHDKAVCRGAGMAQWESTRLPPLWPEFDSRTRRHMWVEFVFGSRPCSEGFSPGSPVFLPPQKSTFLNSNSIWKQWMKSHSVEMPLQIPIIIIFIIIIVVVVVVVINIVITAPLSRYYIYYNPLQ